jgi:hypothetical protein
MNLNANEQKGISPTQLAKKICKRTLICIGKDLENRHSLNQVGASRMGQPF